MGNTIVDDLDVLDRMADLSSPPAAQLRPRVCRNGAVANSVTASDFGSNGPRFESGRGRCVGSLDKVLFSHCPKEKPSH